MSELSITDRGPVRIVLIDGEARMNVLSRALVAELAAESKRAGGDSAIRAMVITGSGTRAFCAGANLKERRGWTDDDIRRWLVELHTALREIERCPKPWIAAVNGLALGGGCELALACDLRIVDPAAQMGLTETRIGIIPGGGGTVRLPRLVGLGRARDMILTARRVPADEALRIGLADRVSAPGGSVDAAVALGNEIAANAPLAVQFAMEAVNKGMEMTLAEGLYLEATLFGLCCATEDKTEGTTAFLEKRAAVFKGK